MNASHTTTTPSSSQKSSQERAQRRPAAAGRQVGGTLAALATTLGMALAAMPASANLLANPGFETSALVPYSSLLAGTITTGVWGHENSAIVGTMPPVVPVLNQMLQMRDDGGGTTQAGQFFAVTGGTTITFGASFDADLPAALANVSVTFFSGNTYGSLMSGGLFGAGLALNTTPGWEQLSVTGSVPWTANYALAQVWYANASLIGTNGALGMGYVDETFAAAVPEPHTYGLMALGLAVLGFKLRRRSGVDGT